MTMSTIDVHHVARDSKLDELYEANQRLDSRFSRIKLRSHCKTVREHDASCV